MSYTLEDAADYFAIYNVTTENLTTHQVDLRLDGKHFVFHHSDLWGTRLYDKQARESHKYRDLVDYMRQLYELADVPYARQTIQATIWEDREIVHLREIRFNLAFLTTSAGRYHASTLLRKTLILRPTNIINGHLQVPVYFDSLAIAGESYQNSTLALLKCHFRMFTGLSIWIRKIRSQSGKWLLQCRQRNLQK